MRDRRGHRIRCWQLELNSVSPAGATNLRTPCRPNRAVSAPLAAPSTENHGFRPLVSNIGQRGVLH
jgi:hypothetical protein